MDQELNLSGQTTKEYKSPYGLCHYRWFSFSVYVVSCFNCPQDPAGRMFFLVWLLYYFQGFWLFSSRLRRNFIKITLMLLWRIPNCQNGRGPYTSTHSQNDVHKWPDVSWSLFSMFGLMWNFIAVFVQNVRKKAKSERVVPTVFLCKIFLKVSNECLRSLFILSMS